MKAYSSVANVKFKEVSRFSMVGIINTVIDFLIFSMFREVLGANFIISQSLGYTFGVINSFILNRKWTFEAINSKKRLYKEFAQFALVNLISLGITLVTMSFLITNLKLNAYLAKLLVTILAQITNFIGYRLWVFADVSNNDIQYKKE